MGSDYSLSDAVALLALGVKILRGEIPSTGEVKQAVSPLLNLLPVDELKPYLTDEARRRDDLIADAAEAAKLTSE